MIRLSTAGIGFFFVILAFFGFASISDETVVGGGLRGGNDTDLLWSLFSVNTVLNFIHLLFGSLTVMSGLVIDRTRMLVWTMCGAFGVLLVYDIVLLAFRTGTDPLAINQADTWLHAIAAVLLAVLAVMAAKEDRTRRSASSASSPGRQDNRP
ncbi:hypothetical protein AOZ06_26275 [Kibdelosporangium phytohabitans]|uniref:DUF4383 domain-containing protein n=2 Tax=Kibdelosporangium phytohabitans TaxID=860235 RepID=A0A0N9I519_9PSEU|nr:hypothetical protein AOZ06_26275 [Kibdelosporangium phytohabitans]